MPDENQTNMNPVDNLMPAGGAVSNGAMAAGVDATAGAANADATVGVAGAGAPGANAGASNAIPVIPEPTGLGSMAADVNNSVVVDPNLPVDPTLAARQEDAMARIAEKVSEAHNVLIALSSDPSVDEMAAAIGLSLFLDRIEKKATAIYSGNTPNALEFLEPEKTFEDNADILRDFVIALDKDKADHLRYKLDGDYVKVYITPYKSLISDEDLEFSYGDYNVELVMALNVANGIDLDAALREHGRIMHDATVVNITTGNPGKFGEIEWSDKHASSVSEMLTGLLYGFGDKIGVAPEEATAFLTGIVAATNRFSKPNTTADTMHAASLLMGSGANQQLIAQNITDGMDNQFFMMTNNNSKKDAPMGPDTLSIEHDDRPTFGTTEGAEAGADAAEIRTGDVKAEAGAGAGEQGDAVKSEVKLTPSAELTSELGGNTADGSVVGTDNGASAGPGDTDLLNELQNTAASLAAGSVTVPDAKEQPVKLDGTGNGIEDAIASKPETILTPSAEFLNEPEDSGNKYGKMLEEALAESDAAEAAVTPVVQNPEIAAPGMPDMNVAEVADGAAGVSVENSENVNATDTSGNEPSEINGVPEVNVAAEQGDVLPPPPAPPVNLEMTMPEAENASEENVVKNTTEGADGGSALGTFQIPG